MCVCVCANQVFHEKIENIEVDCYFLCREMKLNKVCEECRPACKCIHQSFTQHLTETLASIPQLKGIIESHITQEYVVYD